MSTNYIKEKMEKERKNYNDKIFDLTLKYQKKYGFEIGEGEHATWNNEADAFKHAFGSAKAVFDYNMFISIKEFDRHEKILNNNPSDEENMDRWNNYKGRDIAKEIKKEYPNWKKLKEEKLNDIIASKVIERMRNNDLIIKPSSTKKIDKDLINKLDILNITEKDYRQIENIIKDNYIDKLLNNKNKYQDINDVNENIKRIHDNKNKSSSKIFLPNKIDEPSKKDRIILNSILYTFENTDKEWGHRYKIMHTLPKVSRAVANVNNMPLTEVTDLLIKSIKNHKRNQEIQEGRIGAPAPGSGNGHWVTINGNHVFIEDK